MQTPFTYSCLFQSGLACRLLTKFYFFVQICWAGAILLASSHRLLSRILGVNSTKLLVIGTMLIFCCISALRTTALLQFYGAPMKVYTYLPKTHAMSTQNTTVCVGDEWERYPSSFFLPSSRHRLHYLKQNFAGEYHSWVTNANISKLEWFTEPYNSQWV